MKALLKQKLLSRKFLLAVIALLAILVTRIFHVELPVELETVLVGVVVAYVAGESYIDAKRAEYNGDMNEDVEL